MPTILVVDDRVETRDIIVELAELYLPDGGDWAVRGTAPFLSMEEFVVCIGEEDVAVLVLDERLHEQAHEQTGEAVSYDGHNLVEFLRAGNPELPLFVVTSFADDDELQEKGPDVEAIVNRSEFVNKPEVFVKRILRAGQRFSQTHSRELTELGAIADKVARGAASADDAERALALQTKLALPFDSMKTSTIADFVPKAEELVNEARQILDEMRAARRKS